MSGSQPVFAVVGRVNRGKSSIVSTLAADESVQIEARPGTTQRNREYPMQVGDRTLYTLVDTPGFERARHVLAWLRAHETNTAERASVVRRFVAEHAGGGRFPQECELLRPILDGAAILYVVDSSVPFSPTYEAETEILRWTGQPRMALINPIGQVDHSAEWQSVLDQYFSLVRVFDAHQADFDARIDLLRGLREISVPWKAALDDAILILIQDRTRRVRSAAELIAETLVDMLRAREERRIGSEEDPTPYREGLTETFYAALRRREKRLHDELRRIFLHEHLRVAQGDFARVDEDLFDTSTWSRLGLTRTQLAISAAASGAILGGGIDLMTGGASLLAGAAIGGAVGLVSTLAAWQQLAGMRVLGSSLAGKLLRVGPIRDPNFAWIVLDRALMFHAEVANHPHARRTAVELSGRESRVQQLSADTRRTLDKCFARIRREVDDPAACSEAREQLARGLEAPLRRLAHCADPPAGGAQTEA